MLFVNDDQLKLKYVNILIELYILVVIHIF